MKNWKKAAGIGIIGLFINSITAAAYQPVKITPSTDRHTSYIKDYIGTNLASFGYTSMDGKRRDYYGNGLIRLAFVNSSGSYINPEDNDQLKNYVVVDQSVDPNTEIKLEYEKAENGEEYDNLVSFISCDEILLGVREIDGTPVEKEDCLTKINISPDKYTAYIRDYVGRNLADCGYISFSGELRSEYGSSSIQIIPVSSDGSYIDITNKEILQNYKVVTQSIDANTEITFTYLKDANGEEYSNLIDTQSCLELQVRVEKLD